MLSPYLSFGKQVTSTIVGVIWLFILRLVLITVGRSPAASHSLIPVITSVLDRGCTSFSTINADSDELPSEEQPTNKLKIVISHTVLLIGFIRMCPCQTRDVSRGK